MVLATLAMGCARKKAVSKIPSPNSYKEGAGLLVCDETRQVLGVQTAEVTERSLQRRVALPLRVSHRATPRVMLDGMLATAEVSDVRPGQKVLIENPPDANILTGQVVKVERQLAQSCGLADVLVECPDPESRLEQGRSLNGQILAGEAAAATVVPHSSVLRTLQAPCVYVFNGGRYLRTTVKPGWEDGDQVEISDGLYAGDVVVTQGVMGLWMIELQAIRQGRACCDEQ